MRTPIEALKEIRDRLTYFCLRTDGKYDPPWATELVGIIDEAVTYSHAVGNAAAMRDALVKCREIALQWQADEADGVAGTTDKPQARSAAEAVIDMEFEINAALSAPARNCEQLAAPTDSNGNTIHVADKVHMLNTDSRGDHEWDDEVCSLEFVGKSGGDEWLVHGCEGAAWACECEVLAPAAERKGEGDGR